VSKEIYSESIEEYLEAIFRLSTDGGEATTSALAELLKVSPASVSGMVRRLAERGLVKAPRYKPITLTAKGRKAAESVLRKHRLSERLLTDVLGLDWAQAHDEACRLEHAVSDEVLEKMEALLDDPDRCPHGNPVAASQPDESAPLSDLAPGESATVLKIADERGDLLKYLAALGMFPGVCVKVREREPFAGPLIVQVGEATYALGREVCERIRVRPGRGHAWRHQVRRGKRWKR
jgi:DtxR family Mn-dependent transcriptional regulator